jgi:hypothetical protein
MSFLASLIDLIQRLDGHLAVLVRPHGSCIVTVAPAPVIVGRRQQRRA